MTHRYPDPKEVDEALFSRLYDLPNGSKIDLEWIRKVLWPETTEYEVPKSSVVRGMQANMFTLVLTGGEAGQTKRLVCKRIVPAELPDKKDVKVWQQFLRTVRKEINFYQLLENHPSLKCLFPKVLFHASTDPALDESAPSENVFPDHDE